LNDTRPMLRYNTTREKSSTCTQKLRDQLNLAHVATTTNITTSTTILCDR